MSESAEAIVLHSLLQQARVAARRRLAFRVLIDALLGACGLLVIAALVAGWTLRGDLAAIGGLIGGVAGSALVVASALLQARRQFGTNLRTARTISLQPTPLGPGTTAARAREHRRLRGEWLGATELATASDRSTTLTAHYIADVSERLLADDIDPRYALPSPGWSLRVGLAIVLAAVVGLSMLGPVIDGFGLLVARVDARPPAPREPVWSSLALELRYPAHTGRPTRQIPNPSGALRVPAGTVVEMTMGSRYPAGAARIVVTYDADELSHATGPEVVPLSTTDPDRLEWSGQFVVQATGTWTVMLLDEEDDELDDARRRSPASPLQLEPDRPPEVELLPLPPSQREVHQTDSVEVRLIARDDFGLRSATLVYQLPDGTAHRLSIPTPAGAQRRLRRRYDWDISQIPLTERSDVLYWVEVRDNDPGLGLTPLPDPPGKLSRSATQQLVVRDDEAEHAANIVRLREIRDLAVDQLATRMTTSAFVEPQPNGQILSGPTRITEARDLLHRSGQLLARLAAAIDTLSVDTLVRERDIATFTAIHKRLAALYRVELSHHAKIPATSEDRNPGGTTQVLRTLRKHNDVQVKGLEDEIIRLDDLVDGQIIEQLEGLVARLETTQRKLVELLEQLQAGDESVRASIEQLEQRRREDLKRISQARAMLRKEVEQEFMNLDAFEVLDRLAQQEQLTEMLRRGDISQALEQARDELGDVQGLRDQVQQQLGQDTEDSALSEAERARMKLLRELSRLQDEQTTLRSQTRTLHERWRDSVGQIAAQTPNKKAAKATAETLRKALDSVNDARLGREGRRGLDDAHEALERLEQLGEQPQASALELAETARQVARALDQAAQGSQAKEREGQAVRRARDQASRLRDRLEQALPPTGDVLDPDTMHDLGQLAERQRGLQRQARQLLDDPIASQLPAPGRRAMRQADRGMQRSADHLGQEQPGHAIDPESAAWRGFQAAIDSLRRGSPPPPPSASGNASTEAEQDRSLRDSLMDAMREDAPAGYDEPVKRYYEELLR